MENKIRFAAIMAPKVAEVHERPLDPPKDHEIQIKIGACNICTSDYGQWVGLRNNRPFPMAGGHECAGVVVAKGKNVGDNLQIGDHVAMTVDFCGHCPACQSGATNLCENHARFSQSPDGYWGKFWFGTYTNVDARFAVKMSPEVPMAEAAFLEPLATVIHGIKRMRIRPGQTIVVVGAGTMGLLNAQIARVYGANVIISELMEKKLECARSLGFKTVNAAEENIEDVVKSLTGNKGADGVILAVGNTFVTNQAFRLIRPEGKVLFFAAGYPEPEMNITPNELHYKMYELIGTFGGDYADFAEAAALLNNRQICVEKLVEQHFQLDDIQAAYEVASTPGSYRVAVHMWEDM